MKPDDGITQIRFKYKYTWKDEKYTNTKYRHTQIQILLLGVSARSEEERIEIFLQKVV